MAYEDLEQRYGDSLVPGIPQPPAPQPFSTQVEEERLEQVEAQVRAQPRAARERIDTSDLGANSVDLDQGVANFQGIHLALHDTDVRAIAKILAARVVSNLADLSKNFTVTWIDPPADETT